MLFPSQPEPEKQQPVPHRNVSCILCAARLIIMCPSVPAAVICPNHIDFDKYEGIGIDYTAKQVLAVGRRQ